MGKIQELKDEIAYMDKMIRYHQEHKMALVLELKLSCHHMEVTSRESVDYDRNEFVVTCNDCDSILFDGNIFQYEQWKKKYNGELTEVHNGAK